MGAQSANSPRRRPRTIAMMACSAAALASLTLSGCAAGQVSATARESSVIDGNNASVGPITLSAVSIEGPIDLSYAVGSSAPVDVIIANSSKSDDTLVNVTTDAASGVALYSSPADASLAASEAAASSAPVSSSTPTSAVATATASGSVTPAVPSSAAPTVSALSSLTIPAGQRVSIGYGSSPKALILEGLTKELYPAQTITLTFTFQNAGTVTVAVPVHTIDPPANPEVVNVSPSDD